MDRNELLQYLPPVQNVWEVVTQDQSVKDIIKQVIKAHYDNQLYYDKIALFFDATTVPEILDNIYDFIKDNIRYKEESDAAQTTAIPAGILARGFGDCKHYASFAGGILSAIKRLTGKRFSWHYCFASYDLFNKVPYHVFIVVQDGGTEYYLDPVPGS